MLRAYRVSKLLWQAFEMYSWLRVSVSFKQRVCTSRCRSGFGGPSVVPVQLLPCCRSFFCYDTTALLVQWLTCQDCADKGIKEGGTCTTYLHECVMKEGNILNNGFSLCLTSCCCSEDWLDFLFQNPYMNPVVSDRKQRDCWRHTHLVSRRDT